MGVLHKPFTSIVTSIFTSKVRISKSLAIISSVRDFIPEFHDLRYVVTYVFYIKIIGHRLMMLVVQLTLISCIKMHILERQTL